MKKAIIATAVFAVGLVVSLAPNKAQALQYGATVGYSSIGFQLHGGSVEFLLGIGGKDGHRPRGSVIHIGFAGMTGEGQTDLTKASWDGASYYQFQVDQKNDGLARVAAAVAAGATPAQAVAGVAAETDAAIAAYGLQDPTKVKGDGTAYVISAAYEWVFSNGAPGLGVLAGAELYISEGGFNSSNADYPSVKTSGGIGGGGVVGVSYYLRNGINFSFKTGLGAVDPGEVTLFNVKVEPETVFYASPTISVGYIY